jgi:hypothetical protein
MQWPIAPRLRPFQGSIPEIRLRASPVSWFSNFAAIHADVQSTPKHFPENANSRNIEAEPQRQP